MLTSHHSTTALRFAREQMEAYRRQALRDRAVRAARGRVPRERPEAGERRRPGAPRTGRAGARAGRLLPSGR